MAYYNYDVSDQVGGPVNGNISSPVGLAPRYFRFDIGFADFQSGDIHNIYRFPTRAEGCERLASDIWFKTDMDNGASTQSQSWQVNTEADGSGSNGVMCAAVVLGAVSTAWRSLADLDPGAITVGDYLALDPAGSYLQWVSGTNANAGTYLEVFFYVTRFTVNKFTATQTAVT